MVCSGGMRFWRHVRQCTLRHILHDDLVSSPKLHTRINLQLKATFLQRVNLDKKISTVACKVVYSAAQLLPLSCRRHLILKISLSWSPWPGYTALRGGGNGGPTTAQLQFTFHIAIQMSACTFLLCLYGCINPPLSHTKWLSLDIIW